MSLVIAGTFRADPAQRPALEAEMRKVLAATLQETGCIAYSYAQDLADPDLIRVFEEWRDQSSLDAHFASPHMKAWKNVREGLGFSDRRLSLYDSASKKDI